jgi:hypothetical protein
MRRDLGALFAAAILALALFSVNAGTRAQNAHAAAGERGITLPAPSAAARAGFPSEAKLRAAARRHTKDGRAVARASANEPISIRFDFWGAKFSIDRFYGCHFVREHPAMEGLIQRLIPSPWNQLVLNAMRPHKWLMGALMGRYGFEVHFSWLGFPTYIGPSGPIQPC